VIKVGLCGGDHYLDELYLSLRDRLTGSGSLRIINGKRTRQEKQPMNRLINLIMGSASLSSLYSADAVRYVCLAQVMLNRKKMGKVGEGKVIKKS
jgi:hypothetical protein